MSREVIVTLGVVAVATGLLAAGQISAPPPPPPVVRETIQGIVRDLGPSGVRRIPIGTATLSGTVVAADTGRPLPNARVSVSGQSGGRATATGAATQITGRIGAPGSGGPSAQTFLSRQVVTDAQGKFLFQALPEGQFTIDAQRDQFLSISYGQTRPGRPGTPVRLAEGQNLSISIRLPRGGVVSGTVFDEDGLPLANGRVQAMRFAYVAGVRRLMGQNSVMTDDRGIYRIFGLQPGDYVVAVTPNRGNVAEMAARDQVAFDTALQAALAASANGERPTSVTMANPAPNENIPAMFGPTYAPGTAFSASATRMTIGAGEEHLGVDITVVPVRMGGVQGVVAGLPAGAFAQVSFLTDDPTAAANFTQSTQTSPDGTFRMQNLQPGRYTVFAQVTRMGPPPTGPGQPPPQLSPADRLWGRAEVVVDGQVTARVGLALEPPKTVSGTVAFDTARAIDLSRITMTVVLSPAQSATQVPQMGPPPTAKVEADGRFTIAGVMPGRYTIRPAGGAPFARSALYNGDDVLDFPLVVGDGNVTNLTITMSDAGGSVSGALTDARGQPATIYTVIIAPQDRRYWVPGSRRILTARPDADGKYRFGNLPAGAYLLAAVTDLEPGGHYDPEFLAALAAASLPVSVTEGGTNLHDIRLAQ